MFNMQKIGRKISELRKDKNMTQMELADQMGISFQAVSNWERGNSMPDISKLPELAEVLNVSLDELLGEKTILVEAAINDSIEEVITNCDACAEEISEILPILKPEQINSLVKVVKEDDFKAIQGFLPFMDEDDVTGFASKALDRGEKVEGFLPFMDEDNVKELALKALERGEKIEGFLPFMDEDDVKGLALKALERGEKVEGFLPFMDEDDVKELALKALERGKKVEGFLPFMDEDDVKEIALKVLKS